MSRIEEPTRWLDERSGAPDDVRSLLANARDALGPSPEEMGRLKAFAATAAGAGGAVTGASGTAAKAGAAKLAGHVLAKTGVVKLVAVLAVGGSVAGGAGYYALRANEGPRSAAKAALATNAGTAERTTTAPTASEQPPAPMAGDPVGPGDVQSSPAAAASTGPAPVAIPLTTATTPLATTSTSPSRPTTTLPASAIMGPVTMLTAAPSTAAPVETGTAGPGLAPGAPGPLAPTDIRTATPPPGETEIALLDRARSEVAARPAEALRVLDEHRAGFPHGTLEQEREVLAIEALVRLGRRSEARARGDAFGRAFPTSAHRRRIAVLLGD